MAVETIVVQCRTCCVCGESSKIEIPTDGYLAWSDGGEYIEDAFPTLSADERELLITGTHSECWDILAMVDDFDE